MKKQTKKVITKPKSKALNKALVTSSALAETSKEAIKTPQTIYAKDGCLKAVLERQNFHCNHDKYSEWNDVVMFEKYYHQWHTGILLLKSRRHPEGDRMIEPLGMFDNLKDFSRRLHNELPYDKYVSCMLFGGERLSMSVANTEKWEDKSEFEYTLFAVFVDINQQFSNKYHECI